MPALAETQLRLRQAIIAGDAAGLAPLLVGGHDPEKRLAIHRRHYHSSLVTALLTKFPATAWLVGAGFVEEAAGQFVRDCPPRAPCIAEYGDDFPGFLSSRPGAERVPYLGWFSELEWRLGRVAISVDWPPVAVEKLSHIEPDDLVDSTISLQPGLHYLAASWPVDELMKLHLSGTAPDEYRLSPADVRLEVRGARGEFGINRLDAAEFTFCKAVQDGRSIGGAAEEALDLDTAFDAGRALLRLVTEGLVTTITPAESESRS